ncbi:MAG: hypothetical protein HOE62_08130 [Alphaproteobacteria bacterium]|jgi:hypothetical protein|nr:hypothetical protein [Alphaproteobacteria bacterium]MBT4017903.1 hypothetical protein [Alphaproteobacteria bacterium]
MSVAFSVEKDLIDSLQKNPERTLAGTMDGRRFTANVGIANYVAHIVARYDRELDGRTPAELSGLLGSAFDFAHFGLILNFETQTNLILNDAEKRLVPGVRSLVNAFGPIVLRNACLESAAQEPAQRNIFPHMRFHYDRSAMQDSQISLFSRDPNDAEQRFPRQSSTLFVANVVAWLQHEQQGLNDNNKVLSLRASYDLFSEQNVRPLFGDVIFEQPWNAPEGTGELCIIDNRTVLHASFHGDLRGKGWRIGARYLV